MWGVHFLLILCYLSIFQNVYTVPPSHDLSNGLWLSTVYTLGRGLLAPWLTAAALFLVPTAWSEKLSREKALSLVTSQTVSIADKRLYTFCRHWWNATPAVKTLAAAEAMILPWGLCSSHNCSRRLIPTPTDFTLAISLVTSAWPHFQQLQMVLSILYHFSLRPGKNYLPCDSKSLWLVDWRLYTCTVVIGGLKAVCMQCCDWWTEGCMYAMLWLVNWRLYVCSVVIGRTGIWAQAHHTHFLAILEARFSASSGHSGNFLLIYFSPCVATLDFNKRLPWMIFYCLLWSLSQIVQDEMVEEEKTLGLPLLDTEHKQLEGSCRMTCKSRRPRLLAPKAAEDCVATETMKDSETT